MHSFCLSPVFQKSKECRSKERKKFRIHISLPTKFHRQIFCFLFQSVEFHEKGKRHQENVKLRIQEVSFTYVLLFLENVVPCAPINAGSKGQIPLSTNV